MCTLSRLVGVSSNTLLVCSGRGTRGAGKLRGAASRLLRSSAQWLPADLHGSAGQEEVTAGHTLACAQQSSPAVWVPSPRGTRVDTRGPTPPTYSNLPQCGHSTGSRCHVIAHAPRRPCGCWEGVPGVVPPGLCVTQRPSPGSRTPLCQGVPREFYLTLGQRACLLPRPQRPEHSTVALGAHLRPPGNPAEGTRTLSAK